MSNRLTFSLASLTLLIALGLVFAATPAMAVDDQTWTQGEKIKDIVFPKATASTNAGTLEVTITVNGTAITVPDSGNALASGPLNGLTYTLAATTGAEEKNTAQVTLSGRASVNTEARAIIVLKVSQGETDHVTESFSAQVVPASAVEFPAGTTIADQSIYTNELFRLQFCQKQ